MYYLETHALIELFKRKSITHIKPGLAFTSIFALVEYLNGLSENNYEYRKGNLKQLLNSTISIDYDSFHHKTLDGFDLDYHRELKETSEILNKYKQALKKIIDYFTSSSCLEEFRNIYQNDNFMHENKIPLLIEKGAYNTHFKEMKDFLSLISRYKKSAMQIWKSEKEKENIFSKSEQKYSFIQYIQQNKMKNFVVIYLYPVYLSHKLPKDTIARIYEIQKTIFFSTSKKRKKFIEENQEEFNKISYLLEVFPTMEEITASYNGKLDLIVDAFFIVACDMLDNKHHLKKNDDKDWIHLFYVDKKTDKIVTGDDKITRYANSETNNPAAISFDGFLKQVIL